MILHQFSTSFRFRGFFGLQIYPNDLPTFATRHITVLHTFNTQLCH